MGSFPKILGDDKFMILDVSKQNLCVKNNHEFFKRQTEPCFTRLYFILKV
uniref:Uncharacterized protein n=1 Tax=Marseillevirus sp. TaxID=2809551 RepID=A0AA96IY84_9VIRU|nr:hypothetical protein MarDSR_434 [Marseillevirus sp.]